jgi:hypothetical protein
MVYHHLTMNNELTTNFIKKRNWRSGKSIKNWLREENRFIKADLNKHFKGIHRRTYLDQIEQVLEKGHVKSTYSKPVRLYGRKEGMNFMKVDHSKCICNDHSKWKEVISFYRYRKRVRCNVQSTAHQTIHFGICTAVILRALALISNCKWRDVLSTVSI